jgi:hypothetical protein
VVAVFFERFADGIDASVHHIGWCDKIGSRLSMRKTHSGKRVYRGVVNDIAFFNDAVVSVYRIRIERHVWHDNHFGYGVLESLLWFAA